MSWVLIDVRPPTYTEKELFIYIFRKVRELGYQDHFNNGFSDMEKNFTYLIPANSAWDKINRNFASAYKILFTGLFPLQVHRFITSWSAAGLLKDPDLLGKRSRSIFWSWSLQWSRSLSKPWSCSRYFFTNLGKRSRSILDTLVWGDLDLFKIDLILIFFLIFYTWRSRSRSKFGTFWS